MASGHIQEKKDEVSGRIIAYRAVITNPKKLTRSGSPKRESRQFAVTRQPGDRSGVGMTPAQAKKAAEDWLHEASQAFREGRDLAIKANVSVSDAADAWLNSIELEGTKGRGALRQSTLDYYDYLVRCYIHEPPAGVEDIGQLRVSDLEARTVDGWKLQLIEHVSRSVAQRSLMALKAILRFSVVEGWIRANPAADVKLGSEKNKDDSITILLQRGHVRTMLRLGRELHEKGYIGEEVPTDRLGKSNAWQRRKMMAALYPLLRLGFASGARSGELLAAQAWDFDFERNTFRIERTLTKKGTIGPPKTKRGYRTLAIDAETMSFVKARVDQLGLKKDALVFGSRTGNKITGSNLYRSWKRFLSVLDPHLDEGLEPLILPDGSAITSPYHSRHYHASELLQAGVSLGDVSERLGHADTVITQKHYAYLLGDRQAASRAAADRFAAIFSEAAE